MGFRGELYCRYPMGRKRQQPKHLDAQRYAPVRLRLQVLKRDDYKCRYCGKPLTNKSANIDHVKPWARGGKTNLGNLVAACGRCNQLKGNRRGVIPEDYTQVYQTLSVKHRRINCTKPDCQRKHYDLMSIVKRDPVVRDLSEYESVFGMPCRHRMSPNCKRASCLEQRTTSP